MKKLAKYEMMAGALAAILLLVFVSAGQAATIVWGSATDATTDSDVLTNGNLVVAYNVGGASGSVTINGVTFTDAATPGLTGTGWSSFGTGTFGSASSPFTSLSGNYQTLLSSASAAGGTHALALSGLTIGDSYELQLWVNDSRSGGTAGRTESLTSGNSVTLAFNAQDAGGGVGQFTVGSFVADSSSETISIASVFDPTSNNAIQVNAYQLRDVPEPSAAILMFLGFGASTGVLWLRRRNAV